jgi:membrane protease YdiL (CAAX protease family)
MVVGGLKPIEFQFLVPLALSIPFLLFMIIFTGLAEEVGWRGYALPQLQAKFSAEKSSWILGILWGLWHLPSNLMMPLLRGELQIGVVVSVLLALTVGIVGWTIVLTWLFNNTRSLFWIIVMHGLTNTLQSYLILSSNNYPANLFYALLPWAFAIFLLKKYGSQTLIAKHAS